MPPGEEEKMKNRFGELPYSICDEDCDKFGVTYFVVIQKPGDALFVPSGWHHQVWNWVKQLLMFSKYFAYNFTFHFFGFFTDGYYFH